MGQPLPFLPPAGEEALQLDKTYVVVSVDEFTSEVQALKGYRIVLDGGEDHVLAIAAWHRPIVGRKSKLGAFMVALSEDMTTWPARKIQVKKWVERDREIVEVKK